MIKLLKRLNIGKLLVVFLTAIFLLINIAFAADGSGTHTVTPTTTTAGSTGGTYTFTYTAAEDMDSGGISLTIPSGWSTPQGVSGTAGYTTVSTTGSVGVVLDNADSLTGWNHNTSNPKACSGAFAIDTVVKHEGTGSVKCQNLSDNNNGVWYHNISAQNWTNYTTVGFWIMVNSAINNGDLQFAYDNSNNIASPIESLSLGKAIPANTWTHVNFSFGATTRTSVISFGLKIANLSSMGSTTAWVDNFQIGGSSNIIPTFSGNTITINSIALAAGQTITITYGSGGGTSGVTAPSTSGVNTFTTQSRIDDGGTFTNIASSPTVTVTQVAPGTPDMTAATDSGTSSTDNVTNDTTPDFTISCVTGETVTLYDNVTSVGTGTCSGGTVTITASTLSSGAHSMNAKQGNSVASANLSITIDTTADAAPGTPDMTAATDSGTSSTDNITSDTTPGFTISCVTGSTVTLFDNVTSVGSGTCAGGTVTITASTLSSGAHSMNAKQTDTTGNVSVASSNLSITIDTTEAAPGIPDMTSATDSGSSSTDDITNDTTPDFTVSCATGNTVQLFDGAASIGSGTCSGGTVTITSSTLSSGSHNINAKQTDAAGNQSVASSNLAITIDTTAPAAPGTPNMTAATDSGTSSTDDITSDTTPDFTISCVVGSTVQLFDGVTQVASGTCSSNPITLTSSVLSSGAHNMNAKQTDPAGNQSIASGNLAITIDTTAPSAPGVAPDMTAATDSGTSSTDNITSDTTPVFTGSCTTGDTVNLYADGVLVGTDVCATSAYSITSSALSPDGVFSMTTKFGDAAGNLSAASPALSVTIDTAEAVPGIPDMTAATDLGSSSTDNITSDTTPDFTISCISGDTVTLFNGGTSVGSGTCSGGTVTITSSVLTAGAKNMNARQTDAAGTQSAASANLAITIDTTAPNAPTAAPDMSAATDSGTSSTDNITSDSTPIFTGTCTTGDTVNLYADGVLVGSVTCSASAYSITASTLSPDGVFLMTTKFADVAGNLSAASPSLSVTIDTTEAAPGTPDMTAATDSGSSSTDNITSDTTPDFTITCETGATVTLFDNVTSVGSGTCVGGTVTITASTLSSGTHATMNAKQTDPAGNISVASGNLSITIDTTTPAAPGTPDMTTGTDSGISSTDNLTNDATPDFTITCETGATVTLFDNVTSVGTGTCSGGTVTITSSTLSSGTHATMNAKQTDPAGNISAASGNLSITIDTTADAAPGTPDMTAATDSGTSSTDNITSDTTPDFTISCVTGSVVTLFDNVTSVGTGTCAGGTVTITSSTLSSGAHATMNAKQTDAAGNVSAASGNLLITIDTTASTLAEVTPVPDPTSDNTPNYTFSSTESGTITYGGDCSSATTSASVGNNTITFNALSDGTHSNCTIRVTDTAGNISTILNVTAFTVSTGIDHFTISTITSPQTAGTPFNITITAKDVNDNTFTSFTGTVVLSTNATSISPTTSGSFVSGVRTESVTLSGAGTLRTITATRTGGTETGTSNTFTLNNPVPTTTSISPTSKNIGDSTFTMTVNGTNFITSSVVNFGGSARTTTFVSATQLTASIPSSDLTVTGTFNITVTNPTPGGGTSNAQVFSVNYPVPTTTSISPTSKTVGDSTFTMTVNGTNFFSGASSVRFNGSDRTTTFVSSTQLTASIPSSDLTTDGTFSITVFNPTPGGGTSNAQTFTVNVANNPVPTTTSISPTSKNVGDSTFTMTVNGTNFIASSVVKFDGSNRTTTFISATQLTASIPSSDLTTAGTFSITVFNPTPGGGTSNAQTFTVNNLVPTTTSISPTSKTVGDSTFTMTVNGTNFFSGSIVRFGGVDRTTTFISATQVTASIPSSDLTTAGTFGVTVFNPTPGGGTSNAQTFTVNNPVPTTTSISPTSKNIGDSTFTLTVNGTNFISTSVVNFGGSARTTTFVSSTQLTASIPSSDLTVTGTFNITVTNPTPGGGTSNAQVFSVNYPVPTTTSISPTSKTVGDSTFTLTVNGTNFFSGASSVRFNGSDRTTTFVSSTQLTASIPSSDLTTVGTFSITVFNPTPGGGTSNAQTFTVNNPGPTTTSISPTSKDVDDPGFTLTVNGTNFIASSVVKFDGSNRTTTFVSSIQLTASIPSSDLTTPGTFSITVFNGTPGGGTSNAQTFTVNANNPVPTTTSISPDTKNVGDVQFDMTVIGTNFMSGSVVKLDGATRITAFVSSTELTATIPASDMTIAGSFSIVVENPTPGGGDSNAQTFAVNNPGPTIASISPSAKNVGEAAFTLTVTGTGFVSGSVVQFDGMDRTTTFVSSTELTAAIPSSDIENAGSYSVTVINPLPGGGTSNSETLTVSNDVPVLTSISPNSAITGGSAFTLTVNGTNFISGAVVKFDGASRATTFVSSTQLTANILASDIDTVGTYNVIVTNPAPGGGDSNTITFAVSNSSLIITSISPKFKTVGSAGFTMTVNGENFASDSVVKFGGSDRVTTYVSPNQLRVVILESDLTAAGAFNITVFNPTGSETSNPFTFTVNEAFRNEFDYSQAFYGAGSLRY